MPRPLLGSPYKLPDWALVRGAGPMAVLFDSADPVSVGHGLRRVDRVIASFDATAVVVQWACEALGGRLQGTHAGQARILLDMVSGRARGLTEPGTLSARLEAELPALEKAHEAGRLPSFWRLLLLVGRDPLTFWDARTAVLDEHVWLRSTARENDRRLLLELLEAKLAQVAPAAGGEV